jgi:hypothetical protein
MDVILVSDPNSPLRLDPPYRVFAYREGGIKIMYSIKNVSNSSVESFTVKETNWIGANGYETDFHVNRNEIFGPGIERPSFKLEPNRNKAPSDQDDSGLAHASLERNRIWLVMVVRVKFADGSEYDATDKYEQLEQVLTAIRAKYYGKGADWSAIESEIRQQVRRIVDQEGSTGVS